MLKCLLSVYVTPEDIKEELKRLFKEHDIKLEIIPFQRFYTEDELLEVLKDIDGVLAGLDPFTKRVIKNSKRLKIIARVGVGYDNVDVKAATENNVVVTWTPIPELAKGVADEAAALMLAVLRRITFLDKKMREGIYYTKDYHHLIQDVYPLTAGIVGLGRIGTEFAKRCLGFGMKVQYYDIVRRQEVEKELGVKYVNFEELLRTSDVISIHTPLTPETKGLIGEKELKIMKKNAVIINTARGAIIDEWALYKALKEKRIFGAGISVFTKEPLEEGHPFYKLKDELDNLVLLPHEGVAFHTIKAIFQASANDVIAVLEGRKPKYPLNPEVLDKVGLK
jgi:lactate dehydrogenase-like 2-hydroxyacid dehydrogenase